jgi:hypothetical protein
MTSLPYYPKNFGSSTATKPQTISLSLLTLAEVLL